MIALTAGGSLRLVRNRELGQERMGPAFVDGFAAYLLSGSSRFRHGPALGVSGNLTADGGYAEPVAGADQWTVAPLYAVCLLVDRDLLLTAHLGPVFQVAGDHKSRGAEVAVGAGYRVLAGIGLYSEVTTSIFGGAYSTAYPLLSLELGLFLEYEELP